jgi:hypothetical protein
MSSENDKGARRAGREITFSDEEYAGFGSYPFPLSHTLLLLGVFLKLTRENRISKRRHNACRELPVALPPYPFFERLVDLRIRHSTLYSLCTHIKEY